ncbi:RacA protein [Paenibacillus darwinianus]|uniref:RacA protein n=1 Tax=Paenibacillus darwinianus TaxID=1380763 RepID=A0A9W5S1G2_9BACL|nr:MerR family transcriptional regulator [Paenibacillus darwinianus]EXX87782.1 RacA protein [Paenibacillus darwinianus]EXX88156.1 RacA protein [Paenibacillus darwinianus]EXX89035.1 RacA protein [Paenibacillus darwinianus]
MIKAMKTKDMAQTLGVSQTTVKRWVARFPDAFRKDRYGHYAFSEQDIERIRYIQLMVEQGLGLDEITLPQADINPALQPAAAAEEPCDAGGDAGSHPVGLTDDLLMTVARIEAALAQKADEVVSFQYLKQREELEDLRSTVERLMEKVEALRKQLAPLPAAAAESPASAEGVSPGHRRRKRSLLRTLFPF